MAKRRAKLRDRIKELRRVRAGDLVPNPHNWRTHDERQRAALEGLLAEVGMADAVLARELADGRLELVDGHLRRDIDPEAVLPVLVLDVDEAEALKLLAALDPLAAAAGTDAEKLERLLAGVETESAALAELLEELAAAEGLAAAEEVKLRPVEVQAPPAMAWVLIGLPTVRFGEIAADVEKWAAMADTIVETTANDG